MDQRSGVLNIENQYNLYIEHFVNILCRYHTTPQMQLCWVTLAGHLYLCYINIGVSTFWLKIVHDHHTRLRNSTYNLLRQTHANRGGTWVSEIKFLLYSLGFGNVWNQYSVGNIEYFLSAFKQRLLDTSGQTWHADVINNCKLNMYSLYKSSLVTEEYLLVNMYWKHRAALSRFRCVNHKLAIERGRVLRQEMNTRFVNIGIYIVEDEFHVLLVCKLFYEIRVKFIYTHFRHVVPSEILFIQIMSSKKQPIIKDLAAFTYNMLKIYDDFNCTL